MRLAALRPLGTCRCRFGLGSKIEEQPVPPLLIFTEIESRSHVNRRFQENLPPAAVVRCLTEEEYGIT